MTIKKIFHRKFKRLNSKQKRIKMDNKNITELSELVQSSHLNFLLGSGVSTPYLPVLGNIEEKLNDAKSLEEKEPSYKEYLQQVMLPNKAIVKKEFNPVKDEGSNDNFIKTKNGYSDFFRTLTDILLKRKSTILSKQVNVFTTNIDIIMEHVLEELQIEYNDGFSGRFNPVFSLANLKKSIYQRSLHFDHVSEIPVFNIVKVHGSLNWKHDCKNKKIIFSHELEHFDEGLLTLKDEDFFKAYRQLLIVNPEEAKHIESVLNVYYSELLRMYSSELEKENALLFILGFSMADRHIREITVRSAKSNPTLRVFVFCSATSHDDMCRKLETDKYLNISVFKRDNDDFYTLPFFTENVLKKIYDKNGDKTR